MFYRLAYRAVTGLERGIDRRPWLRIVFLPVAVAGLVVLIVGDALTGNRPD